MDLTNKKVIFYVRCYGYKNLLKELTELIVYCSTHNGTMYDPCIFYDLDSSSDDEIRPGLDGVIQMAKQEFFDIVLVYSYHRIHLDYEKFQEIEEILNDYGVYVHAIQKEVELEQYK